MLIGTVWAAMTFTALSLGAVEAPWGKGQSLGEKKVLGETTVCTDGKSHYVVVAPHENDDLRVRLLAYAESPIDEQLRQRIHKLFNPEQSRIDEVCAKAPWSSQANGGFRWKFPGCT